MSTQNMVCFAGKTMRPNKFNSHKFRLVYAFLCWILLLTSSAHLKAETTIVESHVEEILVAQINMIPKGPGAIARGNCVRFSVIPNGAEAKRISSKGWIITSEITHGPIQLVSFAGQAESATSGSCIFGQTNIAVYESGQLIALIYSDEEYDHVLAGLELGEAGSIKVIANGGIPSFRYEIIFRKKRITLDTLSFAPPAQANSCDQQDSMPAIRSCLMDKSNNNLEAVYGEVLARIADELARLALETSQAAFIDYRFRSCSAVFEAFRAFGWVADDNATNCVTSLNRQREDFLLEFFEG